MFSIPFLLPFLPSFPSLPPSFSLFSFYLHPPHLQLPLVQACFEGNVVQLTELIGQREDVNAIVSLSCMLVRLLQASYGNTLQHSV